jgi:Tfp pilus assembly protein PilO
MTRRIALATGLVVALVAVLWWFALWRPQTARLDSARHATVAADSAQAGLLAQINALQAVDRQVPALEKALRTLQLELPSSPELDTTIRQIYAAAQSAKVAWQSLTPQLQSGDDSADPSATPSGVSSVALSISVQGPYGSIMDFIRNLDQLPRLMVVNSLNLANGGSNVLSASLTAEVYFSPGGGS